MFFKPSEIDCWCSPGWSTVASAFAVFVADLLLKLKNCSLGCHIKGICLNAAMFADDLLLMTISLCDLQRMVNLCLEEFVNMDMLINVKKSVCVRIGERHKAEVANIVIIPIHTLYAGSGIKKSKVIKCRHHALCVTRSRCCRRQASRSLKMVVIATSLATCISLMQRHVTSVDPL